jgi:enoyl-[acyl-carrier protein] reductase I
MLPIDLSGKRALVTGVGDDSGFAWMITKYLNAAGADIVLAAQPNRMGILERLLVRTGKEVLQLPGPQGGELKVEEILPLDVTYDNLDDVTDEDWARAKIKDKDVDFSLAGAAKALEGKPIDIVVHAVAFAPEIMNNLLETSRKGYLMAMDISSYSLAALCRTFLPNMEGRNGSVVGLTYLGGDRVAQLYGGGMASAKAALQIDCKQLAAAMGPQGHRVNLVSAGAYPSRAGKAIPEFEKFLEIGASKAPLLRNITREEVAAATAFLCCDLASGITGEVMFVDAGYNVMAI